MYACLLCLRRLARYLYKENNVESMSNKEYNIASSLAIPSLIKNEKENVKTWFCFLRMLMENPLTQVYFKFTLSLL